MITSCEPYNSKGVVKPFLERLLLIVISGNLRSLMIFVILITALRPYNLASQLYHLQDGTTGRVLWPASCAICRTAPLTMWSCQSAVPSVGQHHWQCALGKPAVPSGTDRNTRSQSRRYIIQSIAPVIKREDRAARNEMC